MLLWIRFLCFGVLAAAAAVNATIFTFDGTVYDPNKLPTPAFIPFPDGLIFAEGYMNDRRTESYTNGYGDYVSSVTQTGKKVIYRADYQDATFSYDVGPEGWTPNVRAYFDATEDNLLNPDIEFESKLGKGTDYKSLNGGSLWTSNPIPMLAPYTMGINLVGESVPVKIYDLQLGTYSTAVIYVEMWVYPITLTGATDGKEDFAYSKGTEIFYWDGWIGNGGYITIPINVSAQAARIEIATTSGNDSNLLMKNLRIGQGPGAAYCGDPILSPASLIGDITKDCKVNIDDLQAMAAQWLNCVLPAVCN